MLLMSYLKMVMLISVIVQVKKSKNKKKDLNKKNFLIFIIENGEILQMQTLQKILNLLLDLKVRLREQLY